MFLIWSIIKLFSISNMGNLCYMINTRIWRPYGHTASSIPLSLCADPSWHEAKVISRIWQCPGKCTAAAVSNSCLLILHTPLPPPLGAEKITGQGECAWRAEVPTLGRFRAPVGGSSITSPAALPTLPLYQSALPHLFPFDSQCLKSLPHSLFVPS